MSLVKHGQGDVLREEDDNPKVAKKNWTKADEEALAKENEQESE